MQNSLRRVIKIFTYAILAVAAFFASYVLGGNRQHGLTERGSSISSGVGTPYAFADAPPAGSSGSEGAGGSEGGEGEGEGEGGGSSTGEGEGEGGR